ncbi:MAG: hypothetical protein JXM71_01645 [Spirochaetales bacterium]|nr:hypothetical protein [Spirochaetales bacterium]
MKANTRAITAFILALAIVAPLCAQDVDGEVFAPYPSRIRVGVRGDEVVITWEDSVDVTAGYAVYRHSAFPDTGNFPDALLIGYADSGDAGLVYKPGDQKPYYYFVLGRIPEDKAVDGEAEYRLFIPLRNVVIDAIAVAPEPVAPASTPSASPAKVTPRLSGILARAAGDAIVVSIDASDDMGRLIVYRGTSPLRSPSSLLDAALAAILEPGSGPYKDYPVPGVDYYYAIIPEQDLVSGSVNLEAGVNATVSPVLIRAGSYRVGLPSASATSRSMPLPYLVLTRGFEDAKPVGVDDPTPRARALSAETEKAIALLASTHASATKAPKPPITLFPEDLQSTGGGEEYALRTIVAGPLSKGNYAEAAREFTLYLSLPRSAANSERARFYRGQAQAMSGAYREAFFDMLQTQDSYYIESSAWIDYILSVLRRDQ